MVSDRVLSEALTGFSDTVLGDFTIEDVLQRLARSAVSVLDVAGAGVMLPVQGELLRFSFATGPSQQAVALLGRLQEDLRDGPCRTSYQSSRPVSVADLQVEGGWPLFQAAAVRAGLHAVAAVPLLARGQRWGVLDVYRAEPRPFSPAELAAAATLARVATSYLLVAADRQAAADAQQELAYRAMHDELTGLPVRWVFLEQLTHALTGLERRPGQVGVVFADIDGLKYVNDTYGHDAGDQLLLTCVARLRAAVRPTDVVARLGGDEFVVLLEDLDGPEDAAAVARRVLAGLAEPHRLDGHLVQPSASLGLALTDDPSTGAAALVAHADSAMYRAKRAGRGGLEFYDPVGYRADRAEALARRSTAETLRTALREEQFTLDYQPIFDVRGEHPVLVAAEALLRWHHPGQGRLTAEAFLPDAEASGLMPGIGAWVRDEAAQQLVRWDRAARLPPDIDLFVNVSASELAADGLVPQVAATLRRTRLTSARITLEVTETALVTDTAAASATVTALSALGCGLAIDDFGSGYSSLRRLVDLPAATWKIDRSFTADLVTHPAAAAVISAVLKLGHQLDRTVIVEGVEDAPTLRRLLELGCTHAQGYHLGTPEPPDAFAQRYARDHSS